MTAAAFPLIESRWFWVLVGARRAGRARRARRRPLHGAHGHVVTGMNNQIVWGMPHVFAIFLIVAASGVLNVASIGSVFGKARVQAARAAVGPALPRAAGRRPRRADARPRPARAPDRRHDPLQLHVDVRLEHVSLHRACSAIVAVYLWTLMERRMNRWSRPAGIAAFIWRIVLTTGTGSIFGFLVARQAYGTALLRAAVHRHVVRLGPGGVPARAVGACTRGTAVALPAGRSARRMHNLLGVFVVGVLYFVARLSPDQRLFREAARLRALHPASTAASTRVLFWVGYVVARHVAAAVAALTRAAAPRARLARRLAARDRRRFAQLYVFIIGGQAFPLDIFPGMDVAAASSTAQVAHLRAEPARSRCSASAASASPS